jgi:CelD/BcsL family acetyltransferase involved in cellulose biosynthesis
MSGLRLRILDCADALLDAAPAWDDLWIRSDVTTPTARASLIALWLRHFAPSARFRALLVAREGRMLGALPLVEHRLGGMVSVAGLPSNHWASNGELLLDPDVDTEAVTDLIVAGLHRLPWRRLDFTPVPYEAARWQALRNALARAGQRFAANLQYRVGEVDATGDWETYFRSRAPGHRQDCRTAEHRIERAGGGHLKVAGGSGYNGAVTDLVDKGFAVEDRSWKGDSGSSVLRTPGMLEYFRAEAELLAETGHLELVFLELADSTPIAFCYCRRAKGVYFTAKIGYDPQFARLGPGRQAMMRRLRQLHMEAAIHRVDFAGPLVDWNRRWATSSYPVGRLAVARAGPTGRAYVALVAHLYPRLKRLRRAWTRGKARRR